MTQSSAITISDASTLAVDTSCIDCSEVELQEDRDLLISRGSEILRLEAVADDAIRRTVATIVARKSVAQGEQIAAIQDELGDRSGKLFKFYASINLTPEQAQRYSNAFRASGEFKEWFGELVDPMLIHNCSDETLRRLFTLPEAYKEEQMARVAAGEHVSEQDIKELTKKPEVRLSKTEELLAKARARKENSLEVWEEVKANPDISKGDPEYNRAVKATWRVGKDIEKFEQQIADLKAQIEEEKLKTAEESEAKAVAEAQTASIEKELQKLKFDDAKVRAERVKKLSTTLTVSLPQALADVSKFFAEIDCYDEGTRKHIYNTAKTLANEIADKL